MIKKRILIIAPYNNNTIGLCSLNLYKALCKDENFEVKCVIVHKFKNGYSDFECCETFTNKVSGVLLKPFALLKQVFWLKSVKKRFKPDITISTLNSCSTLNILSGGNDKKFGIFHSPYTQAKVKGLIVYIFTLFEFRFIFSRLNKIICVSAGIKKHIQKSFNVYKNKDVEVIYNIHNFNDIVEKSKMPLTEKEKEIINENSIIYLGRLDSNKAPMRTLEAFSRAVNSIPTNSNLIFIGKDTENLWPGLQDFINSKKGLSERVFFLEYQNNPYKYLSKGKCLISSSYSEGLPGVMIEALTLGKPVLSTNSSGGIWEILSCYDKYNENLDGIIITDDGVITSNLSFYDKKKYYIDIENLKQGIIEIFKIKNTPFLFRHKINEKEIIKNIFKYE